MDFYGKLRGILARTEYANLSNADAAIAINTNTEEVSRGILTVSEFSKLAMKPLGALLVLPVTDTTRAPYNELIAILQIPGVTTVDTSVQGVIDGINGAGAQGIGGFTPTDAHNTLYVTMTVAEAELGQFITEDDVEIARR